MQDKLIDILPQKEIQVDRIEVSSGKEYEYEEALPDEQQKYKKLDINDIINTNNIVDLLDDATLEGIANQVYTGYNMDKESRSHRENGMNEAMNMALMMQDEKTFPWSGASNVIFPLIAEAGINFAARAYPAIVRNDKVVNVKPLGNDKGMPQPVIDPMTGMPAIDPNTGQPAIQMVGAGMKKARSKRVGDFMNYQLFEQIENWEEDTDKMLSSLPITGNIFRKMYYSPEYGHVESELVYPKHLIVNYKTKSLKRAPRITEEVQLYPHEIIERIRLDLFTDFNFATAQMDDENLSEREELSGDLQGDFNNPHLFLQQYCKIDLDGDGYPEPYIVTLHYDTQTVVRIKANFHEDGIKTNKRNEITSIKCEQYYVKYPFLPAPDGGFYDIGFGELLLGLNKTINGTLNRLMDAGTLANTSQGFLARGVKYRGGDTIFRPGEFKSIDTRGMPLKESFVQIQHPEPSTVLFQLLGMLIESSRNLAILRDVLDGQMPNDMSGIAALTMIEQGLTSFKAIYKRIYRSIKQELKLLYRINALYLQEEEYFNYMDDEQAVARADFNTNDIDIAPAADPTIVTDMQRISKAQFLMSFKQDPFIDQMKLNERIFEYIGEDSTDIIVTPPPAPQDPMVELQKAMVQVEQYKAQIKEVEAQSKTQREAMKAQMEQQEAQAKLQLEGYNQLMKQREAEAKLQQMIMELRLKESEGLIKADEAEVRKQKIQADIAKVHADIAKIQNDAAIAERKFLLEVHNKQATEAKEKDDNDKKEEFNQSVAKALASLGKAKRDIKIKQDADGSITGSITSGGE